MPGEGKLQVYFELTLGQSFCATISADPVTYQPSVVVKYLRHKLDNGTSYSTVDFHRSSISKLHTWFHGAPLGSHPLVSQAVHWHNMTYEMTYDMACDK